MVRRIPKDIIERHLTTLLLDFSLEELLEHSNLSPEEALSHLYFSGQIELPDILRLETEAIEDDD